MEVWSGAAGLSDIHSLQNPLSLGQRLASGILITLSLVFPPYLLSKLTLVRKGEIGLVQVGTLRRRGACANGRTPL